MKTMTPMFVCVAALLSAGAPALLIVAAEPAPPSETRELPMFPVRPPAAPERVASGRRLFSVNCSFCHGATAKGGESGPSLVRSALVLDDQNGELIEAIVHRGISAKGMPRFTLSSEQIGDIAAFIHSIPVGEGSLSAPAAVDSLVGDPLAGAAYFNGPGKCRDCHSITGDLAHLGSTRKPRDLQSAMVAGGLRDAGLSSYFALPLYIPPGTTARVALPSGHVYSGTLQHVDEFDITLLDAVSGTPMTFVRDGDTPSVQIHDPLQAHLDLLRVYTDKDIENLTAYLATLK